MKFILSRTHDYKVHSKKWIADYDTDKGKYNNIKRKPVYLFDDMIANEKEMRYEKGKMEYT